MAWSEGLMNNNAGSMLAIWDVELLKNPNWDIYDADAALGANVKVYGHKTNGVRDFCIKALDNQADYTTIEIWDDWDNVNHVGVGNSLTVIPGGTYTLRIRKTIGGYGIRLNDRGFSWINKPWGHHYFLGRSLEFDPNRNQGRGQPIFIGHGSYAQAGYGYDNNPMGSNCYISNLWTCPHCELYNASGGVDQYVVKAGFTTNASVSYASGTSGHFRAKTTANTYELFETRVQEVGDPYLIIGILEGVCALGQATQGLSNGDIVNVEGISWLCCKGANASVSFVRMD